LIFSWLSDVDIVIFVLHEYSGTAYNLELISVLVDAQLIANTTIMITIIKILLHQAALAHLGERQTEVHLSPA